MDNLGSVCVDDLLAAFPQIPRRALALKMVIDPASFGIGPKVADLLSNAVWKWVKEPVRPVEESALDHVE